MKDSSAAKTGYLAEEKILLSHGDGGLMTKELIAGIFIPAFYTEPPHLHDSAVLPLSRGRVALTTDSYVIKPLFFPGGDIGKLSVCGTVNDLAVSGAVPKFLTASFIIEEGFLLADLQRIAHSMGDTARKSKVSIAAGDTKVVGRGQADGLFINTAGVGTLPGGVAPGPMKVAPGDQILINGPVGEHGLTILSAREQLSLQGQLESDCAPLHEIIAQLLHSCPGVKFMRDLTRGGLATAAAELAEGSSTDIVLEEGAIPVKPPVRGLSELLGLDPLYLANEGKFLCVVSPAEAQRALNCLRGHPLGREAALIGQVCPGRGRALLKTVLRGTRPLTFFSGEPLPRIC